MKCIGMKKNDKFLLAKGKIKSKNIFRFLYTQQEIFTFQFPKGKDRGK